MHIRTKNDLINAAETYLSIRYVSILRAFHTGIVENLGGFRHIPPINKPGWILRLVSRCDSTYYLAITAEHAGFGICISVITWIPWKYWEGDTAKNKMYQGDNPEIYKLLRDKELRDDS